ncbi:M4 family metallopeptidase [Embleya scabrispora]|uniref:M4 family metallopeptidase n=1 Tax=Embleya scabrispora TaxID=159449 RepID=UPI000372884C|nr:M4 family metallopeptidase [Embleya scabrispora]MYS87983.1 M4 family peptidase [Streptomyces sp. SID5474]
MHRGTLTIGSVLALLAGLVIGTTAPSNAAPPPTPFSAAARTAAIDAADRAVGSGPNALPRVAGETYLRSMVTPWVDNLYSIAYTRAYRGLPVVGGDAAVLADGTGKVRAVETGNALPADIPTEPTVRAEAAETTARTRLAVVDRVDARRLVLRLGPDTTQLAWETVLIGRTDSAPSRLHVFVDARTGAVLETYDDVHAGTGHSKWNGPDPITITTAGSGGTYFMQDLTRPGLSCSKYNAGVLTKSVDDWGTGNPTGIETGCVDSMWAAQKEWDMLRSWLGRNGHNGNGGTWPVSVGVNAVNAWFDDTRVFIGHDVKGQWLGAMDIVGHEYGHGVDSTSPGYPFAQPGLSEGTGDIFGALTEAYANEPPPFDTPDYTVGEMVDVGGHAPIRYMYNPSLAGDPNCYSSTLPPDHYRATGPLNHWFYLLAEGTNPGGGKPNSPTCNNTALTGVGVQLAGKVFYGGLLLRTGGTNYPKLRGHTLRAAKALDPTCALYRKTRDAWNAVDVPATYDTGCPVAP